MQPFFSIITAVLNRKEEIKLMIESVACQNFDDYELVIIDNGSTDGTLDYLRSLNDRRINIIECGTKGLAFARNMGIRTASGKWAVILDSDNKFSSMNTLSMIRARVEGSGKQLLCLMTRNIDSTGKIISISKFLNRFVDVVEYFRNTGEFSAVVRVDWFKNNLYPELNGAITEFPYSVYAKAASIGGLMISDLVAQVYGTNVSGRICSSDVSDQRAWELHKYYEMLMNDYGDILKRTAPDLYKKFATKYMIYGTIYGSISWRKFREMKLPLYFYVMSFIPSELIRYSVSRFKARTA